MIMDVEILVAPLKVVDAEFPEASLALAVDEGLPDLLGN